MRVQSSDSYINLLLPKTLSRHSVPDSERGLIQELSYGSLRWQLQYDAIIDHLTKGKTLSDQVRGSLQLGLHQLFRMRIPVHAAINETVNVGAKSRRPGERCPEKFGASWTRITRRGDLPRHFGY